MRRREAQSLLYPGLGTISRSESTSFLGDTFVREDSCRLPIRERDEQVWGEHGDTNKTRGLKRQLRFKS